MKFVIDIKKILRIKLCTRIFFTKSLYDNFSYMVIIEKVTKKARNSITIVDTKKNSLRKY